LLHRGSSNGNGQGQASVALTLVERPKSTLAEAYRSLGTSVLLSAAPKPPVTLLVTSSQPNEGKTCTTLNLAQVLAQRKERVLIIDCDMRKGSIAKLLGLPIDKGLSTLLTGGHTFSEVVWQYEPEPGLWAMPAGPVPPNPAELLASPKMAELVAKAAQEFDQVIIDSPPVLPVTDATILSTLVEGVVLVAASGSTPRGALVRTCKILESAGAHILGTVLNKLDLRNQGYYGGYGYYYYYYKGYYSKQPYGSNGNGKVS
jgi:capsular exopolysaccharide synthesis family protein